MRGEVKPLLRRDGVSFLAHAVTELIASEIDELILVTGASHQLVEDELERLEFTKTSQRFRMSFNSRFREGMLSSIQNGIQAASPDCGAYLICLVDQPFLTREHFNTILKEYRSDAGLHGLFRPSWHGRVGNPALVSSRYRNEVLTTPLMDRGCSFLFEAHEDDVRLVEINDSAPIVDIDSPHDYIKFIDKSAVLKGSDGRP